MCNQVETLEVDLNNPEAIVNASLIVALARSARRGEIAIESVERIINEAEEISERLVDNGEGSMVMAVDADINTLSQEATSGTTQEQL